MNNKSERKIWKEILVSRIEMDLENVEGKNPDHRALQYQAFKGLCSFIFRHPKPLLMGLAMVALGTTCALLEPRLVGHLIDDAILPKSGERFRLLLVIYIGVMLARVLTAAQQGYFFELLGQRVTQDLRLKLFSQVQQMPISVFDQTPAGRLLTRVTHDIAGLNEMFSAGFVAMLCNVLLVIGILISLMTLDLKLGVISVSVFPALVWVSVLFSRKLKVTYRETRSKLSALNAFLAENFSGMKIIHLFNRQSLHFQKFEKLNQEYAEAQAGSILVFALFQPIREIADKWNIFLSGMASAERVFSLLAQPDEWNSEKVTLAAEPLKHLKGSLIFERVWFAYRGEDWIFQNFSLEIKPGEKIGVVGSTGAGKSTLIQLLLRFYEPQKGRILLDGKDIRDYDKRALRASIGVVQQDCFLFSGSFEENITFWRNLPTERVHQILDQLGLSSLRERILEERGSNFSLGERQVIAFARALVNDPAIWVLDEATANMDSEAERILQCALESVAQNKTGIFIAHRLATVRYLDRILVLRRGAIQESGSHEDLLRLNGLYARLYRYQTRAAEDYLEPSGVLNVGFVSEKHHNAIHTHSNST